LQFPEHEERNESAKYDDAAGQQIIDARLAECCRDAFSMHQMLDGFFK